MNASTSRFHDHLPTAAGKQVRWLLLLSKLKEIFRLILILRKLVRTRSLMIFALKWDVLNLVNYIEVTRNI